MLPEQLPCCRRDCTPALLLGCMSAALQRRHLGPALRPQKEVLESAANALFHPIAYVDNPRTDTQVKPACQGTKTPLLPVC